MLQSGGNRNIKNFIEKMSDITEKMNEGEKTIFAKYKGIFPFPIVQFATEIGIKVYGLDDSPDNLSGAISFKDGQYSIYLNTKHSPRRMRFTLAHELGHFFNDKQYLESKGRIEDSAKQSTKWLFRDKHVDDPEMRQMDKKANHFAADLLMPEEKFIEKWQELSNPQDVADFFDVSVEAAKVRAACVIGEIV